MISRAVLATLVLCLLSACQDARAREQNAGLTRRVAALEAQVQALRAAQAQLSPRLGAEAQFSAQNCANDLARALETYREQSIDRRYPTPAQLALPDTCAGQHVNWLGLTAHTYTFTVNSGAGQELARQSGGS